MDPTQHLTAQLEGMERLPAQDECEDERLDQALLFALVACGWMQEAEQSGRAWRKLA